MQAQGSTIILMWWWLKHKNVEDFLTFWEAIEGIPQKARYLCCEDTLRKAWLIHLFKKRPL